MYLAKVYVNFRLRGGQDNRMLMPDVGREWAHSSRLACHPGSRQTLAFVRQRFLWPNMVPDVSVFVAACTKKDSSAQKKTPRQAPAGLLQPLPVPGLSSL